MSYETDLVGPGEQRLIVIRDWLRENIHLFTDAFKVDSVGASLFKSPFPNTLDPLKVVRLGDITSMWPPSEGAIRIRICAGGARDGMDYSSAVEMLTGPESVGYRHMYFTNIYVYLHPDLDLMTDSEAQGEKRELVRERISDVMIFGIFNRPPVNFYGRDMRPRAFIMNSTVATGGQQPYDTKDVLMDCRITSGYKGMFIKALGGSAGVFGIHFTHQGYIL